MIVIVASWLFTAGVVIWAICTLISVAKETREDDEKFRYRMQLIQLMYNMTAEEIQEKWQRYQDG